MVQTLTWRRLVVVAFHLLHWHAITMTLFCTTWACRFMRALLDCIPLQMTTIDEIDKVLMFLTSWSEGTSDYPGHVPRRDIRGDQSFALTKINEWKLHPGTRNKHVTQPVDHEFRLVSKPSDSRFWAASVNVIGGHWTLESGYRLVGQLQTYSVPTTPVHRNTVIVPFP